MILPEEFLAQDEQGEGQFVSPEEFLARSPAPSAQQGHERARNLPSASGLGNVLKNTAGAVMSVFEKLDRPRSMIVSGIQQMQGNKDASVLEALKGNAHPSFSEVLPDMNVPIPSVAAGHRSKQGVDNSGKSVNIKHGVGFALDIAGDPVTYFSAGALTKLGKAGKALAAIGEFHGEDVMRGLMSSSPEAVRAAESALRAKGVSPTLIKFAKSAKEPLARTLSKQAAKGQWTAAKFGPVSVMPKKASVEIAKGTDTIRRVLPKVPVLNKFVNYSGDDAWDEGVKNLDTQRRIRQNDILETGLAARKSIDELGNDAFGGASSAGWYERNGGVWMDNLRENKFGGRNLSPEKQAALRGSLAKKGKEAEIIEEGKKLLSGLMHTDLPEINGVKPYFAPGGNDKTFEAYLQHQLSGSAKNGVYGPVQSGRLASLHLASESLSSPDFIFSQKNGNKYFGTVYNYGRGDTMHVVITEMEKDGRIREVTQFVTSDRSNKIEDAIRKNIKDARLEYLGDRVKGRLSGAPAAPPSSSVQHLGSDSLSDGTVKLTPQQESVKLGIAQDVSKLTNEQRAMMKKLGIPLEQIDEAGYSYAPHTLTDEAKKEAKGGGFFRSRNPNLPAKKTPQAMQRDYKWIRDPQTGEEFVGSVRDTAQKLGVSPDDLTVRNATVDEINKAFPGKFKTDLAEATTEAALRNERAISGAEQLNFFYENAKKDLDAVGGAAPANWRRPHLDVPERYLTQDGKTVPIRDTLTRLSETPMPPEKARILEGRWKMVSQPDESVKQLSDIYKAYESAWKRYTLFLFPEYHTRNAVGDIWNGWMNGWKPQQVPGDMHTAMSVQRGTAKTLNLGALGDIDAKALYRKAQDYGVIGNGQVSEIKDLIVPVQSASGRSIAKKIKEHVWDLKGSVKIGEALENNRRLAFFIRRLKDGDSFEQAAKTVNHALFDYADITPFENNVLKRVFPFYTWSRKNIPAQFENLARRPGKVAVMPKIKSAIENAQDEQPPDENVRPEWMRREFSIYGGKSPDGKENFTMLGSYLPTADVFKFGSSPKDIMSNVASSLSPPIKVAAELAANRDFYRDKPIDQLRENEGADDWIYGNERTNYLGINMPTTVQRLSEVLPFTRALATFDRMNPGGIFDMYAATDDGKTRPYHTELTDNQKWLKTLTGLKNYPVDLERDLGYRLRNLQNDTSKAPGLTLANIKMMAKRAYLEGDTKSYEYYLRLLEQVSEKMEREMGLLEQYTESR